MKLTQKTRPTDEDQPIRRYFHNQHKFYLRGSHRGTCWGQPSYLNARLGVCGSIETVRVGLLRWVVRE